MKNNEGNRAQFIGRKIQEARNEAHLSQIDLAKELGFESATAISLIEAGERKVTAEKLEKIAKTLHKDIKFFLGADEGKTVNVEVALRADKELGKEDRNAILRFIELAKQQLNGK